MNFQTIHQGCMVNVDYSFATEPHESLDNVIITYLSNGDEIDYDALTTKEWVHLHNALVTDIESTAIDIVGDMYLNWD